MAVPIMQTARQFSNDEIKKFWFTPRTKDANNDKYICQSCLAANAVSADAYANLI